MKLHSLKATLPLIVLLLSACSPSSTSEALLPTSTPEALLPTLPVVDVPIEGILPYYPLDIVTGVEEIDAVLKAVASGDPQQLRDLFGYTSTTCLTVNALGGPPPCRAGEAEGSPVEVLPFLGPEGSYLHKDEAGKFPGLKVVGVYAVYEASESAYSEENYPAGEYGVMLVGAGSEPAYVLQVTDGQIVRIDYVFDLSSIDDRLERDASGYVLAPKP